MYLESEEELCSLWHRFNVAEEKLENIPNYDTSQLKFGVSSVGGAFDVVDEFVTKLNLTR